MSREQELYTMRDRLARTDKYLAKLYKLSSNLGYKIQRVQAERSRLVERIESLEIRSGER